MDRLRPGWTGELGVVAVSGGADSVALLRALVDCGGRVAVGHMNHELRGEESDGDEAFVVELAGRLGVPVRTHRVNVAALGGNVESTARTVRYEWLTSVANELGADWIATGHTADDQAETVLHRLIRGTGLQGLRGIACVRSPLPRGRGGLWFAPSSPFRVPICSTTWHRYPNPSAPTAPTPIPRSPATASESNCSRCSAPSTPPLWMCWAG